LLFGAESARFAGLQHGLDSVLELEQVAVGRAVAK